MTFIDLGPLSLQLVSEGGPRKCLGVGVRLSLAEPALDLFVLWWMVSITSKKHADWVREQVAAYEEGEALCKFGDASGIPCARCGGDVIEFTVPNDIWNYVIRPDGHERDDEYLCAGCWFDALRKVLEKTDPHPELTKKRFELARDATREALQAIWNDSGNTDFRL